jgi:alkylated DNA repair dioxygenase AlkB
MSCRNVSFGEYCGHTVSPLIHVFHVVVGYRPTLKVYGREIVQSRHIAAFATEPTLKLKYSGQQVAMHSPFPPLIQEIADRLSSSDCLGEAVGFNHCMLNRYENGNIYIGKHSDNLENKVIVTVSLGAPRTFILERKKPRASKANSKAALAKAAQSFFEPRKADEKANSDAQSQACTQKKLVLGNGSLLVMQGDTQKNYTHEIPKERKVTEPRIVSD